MNLHWLRDKEILKYFKIFWESVHPGDIQSLGGNPIPRDRQTDA